MLHRLSRSVVLRVVAVALLPAVLPACGRSEALGPTERPAGAPFMRGPVATVTASEGTTVLHVTPGPGQDACGIFARVTDQTRVLRGATAGALARAAVGDVRVGDTVEVYVSGVVAASCPPQAQASAVILLSRGGR